MLVTHLPEFRRHLAGLASTDRYVRFLKDIAEESGVSITPKTLRSEQDIELLTRKLAKRYSDKSVTNYRSVMRRYVEMVRTLGL